MTRTPRMTRQELAVRTVLVLDAMPVPERLLRIAAPLYALFFGAVMVAGTNWVLTLGLLIAVAGTVASIATVWSRVADDDAFEWEELPRS